MTRSIFRLLPLFAFLLMPALAHAQAADADTIAKALKPILIQAMPATLSERTENWDHQAMVPTGVKWQGLKPRITESPRNHGTWKKMIITAQDLPRTLDLRISDVKTIDKEKQSFKV